jgi:hypothetical protein
LNSSQTQERSRKFFTDAWPHVTYFVRYALFSGVAVLCEIAIFALFFRNFALSPYWANSLSAVGGLAMAWLISGRRIFARKKITLSGYMT